MATLDGMEMGWPARVAVGPMTPKDAEIVANWRFDGPWAVYNLNGQAPQPIDAFWTVRAASGGELIGFFCVGVEARVPGLEEVDGILDLGWGMNPEWVGRGFGGFSELSFCTRHGIGLTATRFVRQFSRVTSAASGC